MQPSLPAEDEWKLRPDVDRVPMARPVEGHGEHVLVGLFEGEQPGRLGPTRRTRHEHARWRPDADVRDFRGRNRIERFSFGCPARSAKRQEEELGLADRRLDGDLDGEPGWQITGPVRPRGKW